jgi:streptogramin lyase
MVPETTVGELDPRTGKVVHYKLPDKDGNAVSTHSITMDYKGLMWLTNQTEGAHLMFDPKTKNFRRFPRPDTMKERVGGTNDVDSKGNPWGTSSDGCITVDIKTGKYTYYKAIHEGNTYGIAADAEDKIWTTFPGIDTLMVVDTAGNISEVVLPPLKNDAANDKDRELMRTLRMAQNNSTPLQKGPRRMSADKTGNYVWVAEYFADAIARIDIRTKEVKEYPLPHKWSQPYTTNVDKEHNVWVNMLNRDAIAKFDPKTEKFTEYQMPTRGTEIRHTAPDNTTSPPTIWVPYDGVLKIARIQVR